MKKGYEILLRIEKQEFLSRKTYDNEIKDCALSVVKRLKEVGADVELISLENGDKRFRS